MMHRTLAALFLCLSSVAAFQPVNLKNNKVQTPRYEPEIVLGH